LSTSALADHHNQLPHKGTPALGLIGTLKLVREIFFAKDRIPTQKLPEIRPNFDKFLQPSEHLKFIWFGHSTLLFNLEGQNILLDPVFTNASPVSFLIKRFQPPVVPLEGLPDVQTIVISHDHYDHLDKRTVEFYREKATRFLVPTGVGQHLRDWGIEGHRITELAWHEEVTLDGIKFRAAPAQHFSGRGLFDRNDTLWASWIIEGKADKIYYSGDSGYGPHFQEIGRQYGPFTHAFMENGQYNDRWPDVHMRPEETIQAFIDLNAETLIPVHWGMFDLSLHHWTEPIVRTHGFAQRWDIPLITPQLGEVVDFFHHPSTMWWEPFIPQQKSEKAPSYENLIAPPVTFAEPIGPR